MRILVVLAAVLMMACGSDSTSDNADASAAQVQDVADTAGDTGEDAPPDPYGCEPPGDCWESGDLTCCCTSDGGMACTGDPNHP